MNKRGRAISKYIAIFLLIFLVLSANFYMLYSYVKKNAISAKEREVMKSAGDFNYFLVESVDAIKLTSESIEQMKMNGSSSEEILTFLERISSVYEKTVNKSFTGFYGLINGEYLDGAGWVPDADYDPKTRPWYTEAMEADGAVIFASPYVDMQTGAVAISVCKRLEDPSDVISMDVTLDELQRLLEDQTIRNEWKYGMILDSDGIVVAHSEIGEIGKDYRSDEKGIGHDFFEAFQSTSENFTVIRVNGERYFAIFSEIGSGWRLVSVISASDVLGSIILIIVVFILSVIVIFAGILMSILKMNERQKAELHLSKQVNSMVDIYDFAFLINPLEDTFIELSDHSLDVAMSMDKDNKSAQYNIRALMDHITDKRFKSRAFEFINLKTLDERLKNSLVESWMFVNNENQKYGVRFVPVERDEEGRLTQVILLGENLASE